MQIKPIEDNNTQIDLVVLKTDTPDTKETPHCLVHGAMNKVSVFREGGGYWRCCTTEATICRAGCIEIEIKNECK